MPSNYPYVGLDLMKCVTCGKLVQSKYRRACCKECSPFGEEVWVEFYGSPGFAASARCYLGAEVRGCGVEWQPNGGYYCQECFHKAVDSKHSENLVS